ncbi:hypothetical protein Tcan_14017 [Toxocara canis]|uniref:Uncharacterized protein n=1 Tax=Toxocara canis TaxID=6265 RepID=A0A0B2VSG8_TOXCA|nr:hypothetical protein Tcan_14017 [Toxocara canis]
MLKNSKNGSSYHEMALVKAEQFVYMDVSREGFDCTPYYCKTGSYGREVRLKSLTVDCATVTGVEQQGCCRNEKSIQLSAQQSCWLWICSGLHEPLSGDAGDVTLQLTEATIKSHHLDSPKLRQWEHFSRSSAEEDA